MERLYGVELRSPPRPTLRHSGGMAAGFARTPLGAACWPGYIGVRANAQSGPRIFTAVIRGQVTGPDGAALLARAARPSPTDPRPPSPPG